MNFGDLLFALNCDPLKNEIRKIEKINKRIVETKNGIYFNEICLKEGLQATFSNIFRYILKRDKYIKNFSIHDTIRYLNFIFRHSQVPIIKFRPIVHSCQVIVK